MKSQIPLNLKFLVCLAAIALVTTDVFSALEVQNGPVSSITASNAVLSANLVSTNATNAAVTVYYGAGNGGTNIDLWQYSNYFGVVSTGLYSFTTTNLPPATYFYYRANAAEGTNTAWASVSSNFMTSSRPPTNYPASTNPVTVMAWSNGVLAGPADFFSANGVISITNIATPGYVLTADESGNPIWQPMTVQATNESDSVFTNSPAYGITSANISNWIAAYGWGNHALYGYLSITSGASYFSPIGHNHDGSYAALGHLHSGIYSSTNHTHSWTNQFSLTNHMHNYIPVPTNDANCTNKILYSYGPGNRDWVDLYSLGTVTNWQNIPTNVDQSYVFQKVNIGPSNLFATAPHPLNIKGVTSARAYMSIIGGIMTTNQISGLPGYADQFTNTLTPRRTWNYAGENITNLYLTNGAAAINLENNGDYSDILRLSFWSLNVPLNATIIGVTVQAETYNSASQISWWSRIWNNGYTSLVYSVQNGENTNWIASSWGMSNSTWGLSSLSPAQVNANDFSIDFWCQRNTLGSSLTKIRNILVTVFYTSDELGWTHGVNASGNYTIRNERVEKDVLILGSNGDISFSALTLGGETRTNWSTSGTNLADYYNGPGFIDSNSAAATYATTGAVGAISNLVDLHTTQIGAISNLTIGLNTRSSTWDTVTGKASQSDFVAVSNGMSLKLSGLTITWIEGTTNGAVVTGSSNIYITFKTNYSTGGSGGTTNLWAGGASTGLLASSASDTNKVLLGNGWNAYNFTMANNIATNAASVTTWLPGTKLTQNRIQYASCVLNDKIFIGGGWNSESLTNVSTFDGTNWVEVLGMPNANRFCFGDAFQNKFWILGGDSAGTNVIVHDGTNWTWGPAFPGNALQQAGCRTFQNKLWVYGGHNGEITTNVLLCNGTNWTWGPKLPVAERFLATTVFHDKLWIFGGTAGAAVTNVWACDGTNWTWKPALPLAASAGAAGTNNQEQVVLFGFNSLTNTYLFDGTNYTPLTTPPNNPYEITCAGNFHGRVYAIGGLNTGTNVDYLAPATTTISTNFYIQANSMLICAPQSSTPTATKGGIYTDVNGIMYICTNGSTWVSIK